MKKVGRSILFAAVACTTMAGYASAKGELELSWAPFTAEHFSFAQINADFRVGERLVLGASVDAYEEGGAFAGAGSLKLGMTCSRELPGFLGSKTVEGMMYAGPRWYPGGGMSYIVGVKHDIALTDKVVLSHRLYTDAFKTNYCNLSLGYSLNSAIQANLGVQQIFHTDLRTEFNAIYAVSAGLKMKF